jgi:ubiquinone/menaquinone biosynthesis C-methylase UbiE
VGVIDFYDRHPISEEQVLAAVARRHGGRPTRLSADDLFDFDMDHYGGRAAVDALARRAGITGASRVLDLCAGLGGPARFLASRRGCRVVALELNAGRAAGARRLTRLCGLTPLVHVVRGDATVLPFGGGRFDACVSEEALLHVEDKPAVLAECRRVLVPGGRLAFTDWIAHPRLTDGERRRLREWMAATTLQGLAGYRVLLGRAGFTAIEAEDLSDEWRGILRERLAMYRALRADTVARLGEARYHEYAQLYAFFVGLIEAGKLGGGRFSGSASGDPGGRARPCRDRRSSAPTPD